MDKNGEISRRTVMRGIVATAVLPALAKGAFAGSSVGVSARANSRQDDGAAIGLPRYLHSAVAMLDGRILVSGGYHANEEARQTRFVAPSTSVQLYDPATNTWQNVAPMRQPRARHASALLHDGRVAVIGGYCIDALDSVEIYEPSSNTWIPGSSLPRPICDHTACLTEGKLVITGGSMGTPALVLDAARLANRTLR